MLVCRSENQFVSRGARAGGLFQDFLGPICARTGPETLLCRPRQKLKSSFDCIGVNTLEPQGGPPAPHLNLAVPAATPPSCGQGRKLRAGGGGAGSGRPPLPFVIPHPPQLVLVLTSRGHVWGGKIQIGRAPPVVQGCSKGAGEETIRKTSRVTNNHFRPRTILQDEAPRGWSLHPFARPPRPNRFSTLPQHSPKSRPAPIFRLTR